MASLDERATILRWERYGDPRDLWREQLGVPPPAPGETEADRAERRRVLIEAMDGASETYVNGRAPAPAGTVA